MVGVVVRLWPLMSEAALSAQADALAAGQGQFEQEINALYLEQLGDGMYAKALDGDVLREFLSRVPKCEEALKGYEQDGNKKLLAAL